MRHTGGPPGARAGSTTESPRLIENQIRPKRSDDGSVPARGLRAVKPVGEAVLGHLGPGHAGIEQLLPIGAQHARRRGDPEPALAVARQADDLLVKGHRKPARHPEPLRIQQG